MSITPESDNIRIGTAERDQAVSTLAEHFAAGRLSNAEHDSRLAATFAASTRGDIRVQFADLPAPHPPFLLSQQPSFSPQPTAMPVQKPNYQLATASDKSKVVAGILQIVLPFGVGRFYTGHTSTAVAQLIVTFLTLGIGAIWSFIDGIMLLVNGGQDAQGRWLQG